MKAAELILQRLERREIRRRDRGPGFHLDDRDRAIELLQNNIHLQTCGGPAMEEGGIGSEGEGGGIVEGVEVGSGLGGDRSGRRGLAGLPRAVEQPDRGVDHRESG